MKIIKILISMTMINTIFVMGLVRYASLRPLPSMAPVAISQTQEASPQSAQTALAQTQAPSTPNKATPKPSTKATPKTSAPTTKVVATPKPTAPANATPKPTATPAPKAAGCVIQIDGVKYEITSLTKSHSGGNIFTCGSDMSAIFWGRHNAKILQIMQKYKI